MALSVQVASEGSAYMAKPVGLADVFMALFWLIAILFAAYFVTKFITTRSLGLNRPSGNKKSGFFSFGNVHPHIKIVDRISLSKEKALIAVVYQGKQYFLAISENNIEVIHQGKYREPEIQEDEYPKYRMPDNFITRFINKQNKTDNINKTDSFEKILKDTRKKKKRGDGG